MKVIKLLFIYISICVLLIGSSLYFGDLYFESDSLKTTNTEELANLEDKVNKGKIEINKLEKSRADLQKYLKSSEYRPPIKDFKDFLLLEKKLSEFIFLNELKIKFSFSQNKKIDNFKMFIPIEIKAVYDNPKEINKFLEYLTNLNKLKVKNINFENKKKEFIIQAEILSEIF